MTVQKITIQIFDGPSARAHVDALYERNGSGSRARDQDTFFIAWLADQPVGCVRYCIEECTHMLRSMMIDEPYRRLGIGRRLLGQFAEHLERHQIRNTYCLPFSHLQNFYASIGFQKVPECDIPPFLVTRLKEYEVSHAIYICMRRP